MGYQGEDLAAGASVSLVIKWQDAKGGWLSLPTTSIGDVAPLKPGWQSLTIHVETGQEALWQEMHYAVILLTVEGASGGTVWFDDFAFDEVRIGD